MELAQRELGLEGPFICESGGVVCIPESFPGCPLDGVRRVAGYAVMQFGLPHSEIVERLYPLADRFRVEIVGFSQMSVEAVAREFGTPLLHAQLAKLRDCSEPFRFLSYDVNAAGRLFGALRNAGIGYVRYGRYVHAGAPVSYEAGAAVVCRALQAVSESLVTAALGDGIADGNLLEMVDLPVIAAPTDCHPTLRHFAPHARLFTINSVEDVACLVRELAAATGGRPRCCPR